MKYLSSISSFVSAVSVSVIVLAARGDLAGGGVHYSVAVVDGVHDNSAIESDTDDELEYNVRVLVSPLRRGLAHLGDLAIGGATTFGRAAGTQANPGLVPLRSDRLGYRSLSRSGRSIRPRARGAPSSSPCATPSCGSIRTRSRRASRAPPRRSSAPAPSRSAGTGTGTST